MVLASRWKLSIATLFLAACALENPCATGVRSGTRCKVQDAGELDADDGTDDMDDAAVEADQDATVAQSALDSSTEEDGGSTGSRLDAGLMDVGPDGRSGEAALSDVSVDGSPDNPDALADADAESEADVSPPPACPENARDAWRTFQTTEQIVPAIGACYAADPLCRTGKCDMASCLQKSAEIVGCDACIAAEVACAAEHCAVECSIATDDEACRACTCANRCLDAPAGCGLASRDICADCSGAK